MFTDPIIQWAFTIVFALLTVDSLIRTIHHMRHVVLAVSHGLHVVMSADMIAMAWPWWDHIPWLPQVLFFGLATVWFLVLWALSLKNTAITTTLGHPPSHQFMHALMMAAMAWMVAVMVPDDSAGPQAGGHSHHEFSPLYAITGSALTASLLLAGVFTALTTATTVRRHHYSWGKRATEEASTSSMNFGMAGMCLLMLGM